MGCGDAGVAQTTVFTIPGVARCSWERGGGPSLTMQEPPSAEMPVTTRRMALVDSPGAATTLNPTVNVGVVTGSVIAYATIGRDDVVAESSAAVLQTVDSVIDVFQAEDNIFKH